VRLRGWWATDSD